MKRQRHKLLRLANRVVCTTIVFALFVLFQGCGDSEPTSFGPKNSRLRTLDAPVGKSTYRDLKTQIDSKLTPKRRTIRKLPTHLKSLARKVQEEVRRIPEQRAEEEAFETGDLTTHLPYASNKSSTNPTLNEKDRTDVLATDFRASGMDRKMFSNTFMGELIRVARWRYTPSSPRFEGHRDENFRRLLESCFKPWLDCRDFRIEFQPFGIKTGEGEVRVDLIAEAFGRPGKGTGRQATAIWNTVWEIDASNGRLRLKSVVVRAQEEVLSYMPSGTMFADATSTILKRCTSLDDQLKFGLDTWGEVLPGLDVLGRQGVAVGDANNDGLDDIYVCQGHGLPNLLLIQNPDGTVDDVSEQSGVDVLDESLGALIIDIDNDGDQDLVISTDENLVFMSNKGVDREGKVEFQLEHAMPIGRGAHSIAAGDYDLDGDLDLFLCKYQPVLKYDDYFAQPNSFHDAISGGRNVLLRNDEGWTFKDVTSRVGLTDDNFHYSQSAAWVDFDADGDLDLYVVNEFNEDVLLENRDKWFGNSTSKLKGIKPARHQSVSVGEFDGDGKLDLFVGADLTFETYQNINARKTIDRQSSEAEGAFLSGNQVWYGGDEFRSFPLRAPLFMPNTGFSTVAGDLNNDGMDDVVMTTGLLSRQRDENVDQLLLEKAYNQSTDSEKDPFDANRLKPVFHEASDLCRKGYSYSGRQRNRCYVSIGTGGFANYSAAAGLDFLDDARAIATTDWDRDGDLDLVMTSRNGPQLKIMLNQMPRHNNFVILDLVGVESNRDAIGARVEIFVQGKSNPIVRQVSAGSGYLSQSSKRLNIGLGKQGKITKAVVIWPTGKQQTYTSLKSNTHYKLVENQPEPAEKNLRPFRIAVGNPLGSTRSKPDVKRSVFYPAGLMPSLEYQAEDSNWYNVENIDKMPLLIVCVNKGTHTAPMLNAIKQKAQLLAEKNIDVLGLYLEGELDSERQIMSAAKRKFEDGQFPFRWGAAASSSVQKLELMFAEWFSQQSLPKEPFALLLDQHGHTRVFYQADEFDAQSVIDDLSLLNSSSYVYRQFATPKTGIWVERYRHANLYRLQTRLGELGFRKDANLLVDLKNPKTATDLAHRAYELEARGERAKASAVFEDAIKVDPKCVIAYVGQGQLSLASSSRQPANEAALRNQFLRKAELNFEAALELDPLNTDAILGRAKVALERRQIDLAIGQLEEYLEFDPDRYEVHAVIGRLFFRQNDHDAAAKHFSIAFDNRPSLPFLAGDLGKVYLVNGKFELARSFLEYAVNLQPSDIRLKRLFADAEFLTGNYAEAVELMRDVVETQPTQRRPKEILAWLLATCPYESSRNGSEALKIANPLVKIYGKQSPRILEIAAAANAEAGQFDKAVELQKAAFALLQDSASIEVYTDSQREGLSLRLEFYQRGRAYRMADLGSCPIPPP